MGAPGQSAGAPVRRQARQPAAPGPAVPRPLSDDTTTAASTASMLKAVIVELLIMMPDIMKRPAAAVVRAIWPGFRAA
jgi:hypothetical protein